ncbi:maleylpyruvate isomerase N-terminal domain-containing protein [Micromonospora sp. PSH25]|nr:maleylpyruvate isomerase N-terminal domain-containing protein [Micromonospora foliorum]MCG5440135.1 maleylpyruvate isomerase N-terminal domain-containing protein [Micromonospora foliorum]
MEPVRAAFSAECARFTEILAELTDDDLNRPTDCPPWNVRDLIAHTRTGAGRLTDMLAVPASPRAEVNAAGYFGAAKFTAEVDADRIADGQREALQVGRAALATEFDRAWRDTEAAVAATQPDRVVRTRHGDAMRLDEFLRTRVVEVGVHGLDLAAALGRPPWLTPPAAVVIAELLTGGRPTPAGLSWDRLTLIRKATGRAVLTAAERAAIDAAGFGWLAFGR